MIHACQLLIKPSGVCTPLWGVTEPALAVQRQTEDNVSPTVLRVAKNAQRLCSGQVRLLLHKWPVRSGLRFSIAGRVDDMRGASPDWH